MLGDPQKRAKMLWELERSTQQQLPELAAAAALGVRSSLTDEPHSPGQPPLLGPTWYFRRLNANLQQA